MENKSISTVETVFAEVLENLAFMFADPSEKEALDDENSEFIQTSILFTGHKEGKLKIIVPVNVAKELAGNILGIDTDDEIVEADYTDALDELMNVVCGNVLTELYGIEPIFNLSIPQAGSFDPDKWQAELDKSTVAAMNVDGDPVLLEFDLK